MTVEALRTDDSRFDAIPDTWDFHRGSLLAFVQEWGEEVAHAAFAAWTD